jgi:5-methylcytosine-specific restriction protein A
VSKRPMIDPGHGGRKVPEWIGASADSEIPDRVKLRIWRREDGICYLTGKKIHPGDAFQYEDVVPVSQGGKRRESNIRLALDGAHKVKSAEELEVKAKNDAVAKKHVGIKTVPVKKIDSAPFAISERTAKRKANPKIPCAGKSEIARRWGI